jgi:hypothetical protein
MLAKLAIEPLGGWHLGKCVTVDNVYVACARAMNLKVKDPEDPLSYGQALRDLAAADLWTLVMAGTPGGPRLVREGNGR